MLLDSTGGRIHLPLSVREITQFKIGDTVRYYKRDDIIIIFSAESKNTVVREINKLFAHTRDNRSIKVDATKFGIKNI